jgi:cytochrome b involved in lipid metabolism
MIAGSIETGHSSYNCYGLTTTTRCEEQQRQQHRHQPQRQPTKQQQQQSHLTPSDVARQDFAQVMASHDDIESMPIYTAEQVAANNGENGTPIWLTYGGVVYDVTDFVANHPGGSQLILQAAGSAVEPYWHLYRQHFASDLPIKLLENMVIGQLDEKDQDAIDEQMAILEDSEDDPYDDEPLRHRALLVHSDTPMNAETRTLPIFVLVFLVLVKRKRKVLLKQNVHVLTHHHFYLLFLNLYTSIRVLAQPWDS